MNLGSCSRLLSLFVFYVHRLVTLLSMNRKHLLYWWLNQERVKPVQVTWHCQYRKRTASWVPRMHLILSESQVVRIEWIVTVWSNYHHHKLCNQVMLSLHVSNTIMFPVRGQTDCPLAWQQHLAQFKKYLKFKTIKTPQKSLCWDVTSKAAFFSMSFS